MRCSRTARGHAGPARSPRCPTSATRFHRRRTSRRRCSAPGWTGTSCSARSPSTAGRALRGADVRLELDEDAARATARVDFDGLAAEELPLPGPGPLALPSGEGVSSASANQSLTTVFLARIARELYPDSRFVPRRAPRRPARACGFEDPSCASSPGRRSRVLRPERDGAWSSARAPRCATRPRCARCWTASRPTSRASSKGSQGLGATGLTSLLLVAPDAPLTPAAFALLAAGRRAQARRAADPSSSTRSAGSTRVPSRPGPRRLRADRRRVRRRLLRPTWRARSPR